VIAVIDILGLVIAVMALVFLAVWRTRERRLVDNFLILSLLAITVVIDLGNFLEWSGITPFFDTFEDYLHVLVAAFWGFFIVSLTQGYYETAYKWSENRYRDVVQGANSIIIRWSPEGRVLFLNRYGLDFFGYREEKILGCNIMDTIVPQIESTGRDLKAMIRDMCRNPENYLSNENENMRKDGGRVWVSWTNTPVLDEDGRLQEILSIGSDITKRKEAEEKLKASLAEKEILIKEVHHRVKNNLQVVSGLLNLQALKMEDEAVRSVFNDSQHRILSMALIHQELYQSQDLARVDFGAYIRSLSRNLLASYGDQGGKVSLEVDADSALMVVDTAIPGGLILNELLSNALTHAFPDGNGGNIVVRFRHLEDGRFHLEVSDDGVGLPDGIDIAKTETMGLQLVALLADPLGAELEARKEGGTHVSLTFKEYFEAGTTLY
jgi:PAS domain S-box-containing protein